MPLMTLRTSSSRSTHARVVTSPAMMATPVFTSVSQATRERLSRAISASSTASEIWSATLSGWPSETDSDVNRTSLTAVGLDYLLMRIDGYYSPAAAAGPPFAQLSAQLPVVRKFKCPL